MVRGGSGRFFLGMLLGFLLTGAGVQLASWLEWGDARPFRELFSLALEAAHTNLQGSVVLFMLVLAAYVVQLAELQRLLRDGAPHLEQVIRREQLLDLCASLFFGIGVIWTAIGMRSALLYALGDSGDMTASSGMAVLKRLVDGGILLALSTTIVGGIGGYLMRAVKQLTCGQRLAALYLRISQQPIADNLAVLRRIENRLAPIKPRVEPVEPLI